MEGDLREDIHPKNILMIGPTGVGKTEIARRLAKLSGAPFVKVEASKFTEVGYVGRDVESMVRDLVEVGITLVRDEEAVKVRASAERIAEERLLDALFPRPGEGTDATRERLREKLRRGRARRAGGGDRDPGARRVPRSRSSRRRASRRWASTSAT